MSIALLTFSSVFGVTLKVLNCVELEGESYMRADVRVKCRDLRLWQTVAKFVFLPYLALVVLATLLLAALARRSSRRWLRSVASLLVEAYREHQFAQFWDAFVLLRRLLIGVFVTFVPLQSALFLINLGALIATLGLAPHKTRVDNRLDVLATGAVCFNQVHFAAADATGVHFALLDTVFLATPIVVIVLAMAHRYLNSFSKMILNKIKSK